MSIHVLTSARGCGTSTAVLALALTHPASLLVEADPRGGDVLAGWLRGRGTPGGVLTAAVAARRAPTATAIDAAVQPLTDDPQGPLLLSGLVEPGQALSLRDLAPALIASLQDYAANTGRTVIVDGGRAEFLPMALLHAADTVSLLLQPSLPHISAAAARLPSLRDQVPEEGKPALRAVLVGDGPYRAAEISAALTIPVFGAIPFDASSAAVLAGMSTAGRGFLASPLMCSAATFIQNVTGDDSVDPGNVPIVPGAQEPPGPSRRRFGRRETTEAPTHRVPA